MTILFSAPSRLQDEHADPTLCWANIEGKQRFIPRRSGTYKDICYDHRRSLAKETGGGVFREVIDTIRTGKNAGMNRMDTANQAMYRSLCNEV